MSLLANLAAGMAGVLLGPYLAILNPSRNAIGIVIGLGVAGARRGR